MLGWFAVGPAFVMNCRSAKLTEKETQHGDENEETFCSQTKDMNQLPVLCGLFVCVFESLTCEVSCIPVFYFNTNESRSLSFDFYFQQPPIQLTFKLGEWIAQGSAVSEVF